MREHDMVARDASATASNTTAARTATQAEAAMPCARDVEFLFEVGSLRNLDRTWRQHLGTDCASDLEHTVRVAWIALLLARYEGVGDPGIIVQMALIHDIAETRTSDFSYVQKVYVQADEHRAIRDLFRGTTIEDFTAVVSAYERRDTIEAKLVKDADNLDVDLELKELEERGHRLPGKWRGNRRLVRDEKLYTESARRLWDLLQTADPASWHLAANKWVHMPTAGR